MGFFFFAIAAHDIQERALFQFVIINYSPLFPHAPARILRAAGHIHICFLQRDGNLPGPAQTCPDLPGPARTFAPSSIVGRSRITVLVLATSIASGKNQNGILERPTILLHFRVSQDKRISLIKAWKEDATTCNLNKTTIIQLYFIYHLNDAYDPIFSIVIQFLQYRKQNSRL